MLISVGGGERETSNKSGASHVSTRDDHPTMHGIDQHITAQTRP